MVAPVYELNLSGTWTDVSDDVYTRDVTSITRGMQDEGTRVDPGKCTLTLNNRDGRYSTKNPTSPLYGAIGRNTPLRVSVRDLAYLDVQAAGSATTPDTAALDIAGDIDIRVDLTSETLWDVAASTEIMGKYDNVSGPQRAWRLTISAAGYLTLLWSPTGATSTSENSTVPVTVPPSGRLAVRVTLDVDNGAGSHVVTFYTAETIAGPWTQLGNPLTTAGTTSIFNSSAPLQVGATANTGVSRPTMRVHAAELRDGIGGTVVAAPDFTAQAVGATSFADSAGRTWTVNSPATVGNLWHRFCGEISNWPTRWAAAGADVWTPVEAQGILRRLGQGRTPLRSPMAREFSNPARTHIVAYWPMEDGEHATVFAAAESEDAPLAITGAITPADYGDWQGSAPLPTMGTGTAAGPLPVYTATGQTACRFHLKAPAGGVASEQRLVTLTTTGTAVRWTLSLTTAGDLRLRAFSAAGATILDSGAIAFAVNGLDSQVVVGLVESGGSVNWSVTTQQFDTTSMYAGITQTSFSGSLASNTVGRVTTVALAEDQGLGDTVMGHLSIADDTTAYAATTGAIVGWVGEYIHDRLTRLCAENEISFLFQGLAADGAQLGIQPMATLLDVLEDAAAADGGILYEQLGDIGLVYRTRASLYNQPAALELDFERAGDLPPGGMEPADDDQGITNDVTVKRTGGSSARAVLETGRLSVLDPPDGIGRYEDSPELSLWKDSQLADAAGWALHVGTWDEMRWPDIPLDLLAAPHLVRSVLTLDSGDRLTIDNPPTWLPPGQVDQHVQGWTETLNPDEWRMSLNCTPGGPWQVGVLDDDVLGRADTTGSTLVAAVSSSDTVLTVATTDQASPRWTTDGAQCPFDIEVGGEVCTVTAVTDGVADAFARTASSGWGSADTGQAWTTSGGSASDYSVSSGTGRHTLGSVNTPRRTLVTAPSADFDVQASIASSALATGASIIGGLLARYINSGTDFYQARLEFTTARAVILTIRKTVAGADSQLATFTPPDLQHTAAVRYAVRFQGQGTALRAKVWPATGVEPDTWHVTATDSALTAAGSLGCRSTLASGNTNVSPVVDFDDVRLLNPQRMTVTRSTNGIVKAQAAGEDLQLATPMILAR